MGPTPLLWPWGTSVFPKALSWTCSSSCLRLPISGLSPTLSFHALAPARPDPSQVSATTCLLTGFHAALLEETKALLWPGSDFPQTPITLLAFLLASLASLSTAAASEFARNLPLTLLPGTLSLLPSYTEMDLQHPTPAFLLFNPARFRKALLSVPARHLGSKLKELRYLLSGTWKW